MRDVLAHPGWDEPSTALARDLAARLRLRTVDVPRVGPGVDAALVVTPVGLRSFHAPATPVVVVTRSAAAARRRRGVSIVCGLRGDDDTACVAIAGALAEGLGLP